MNSSMMAIPQYSAMTQVPTQQSGFSGTVVASSLPKVLTFATVAQGNVVLYEVTKLVILLVPPSGMEITITDVKRDSKMYTTPHGEKNGYVFYKNNPKHMEVIDNLFQGPGWRANLSEPLPEPVIPKDPIFICEKNVMWEGKQFNFLLEEYSDKSLTVFVPVDITKGDDKLLKPCRSLVCTKAPGGKANGYLCYKSNAAMINFVKSFIPDIPFETMYKKSTPVAVTEVRKQADPQFLETKQFFYESNNFSVEFFEYSPLAIAVFPTPIFNIPGCQLTPNLNHPSKGQSNGYIIAKGNRQVIDMIKTFFHFENLETLYTMTDEPARSLPQAIPSAGGGALSNLGLSSFDDIPIETLVRLLKNKLDSSSSLNTKELIGGDILLYGPKEVVNESIELYSDGTVTFTITTGDKDLRVINI